MIARNSIRFSGKSGENPQKAFDFNILRPYDARAMGNPLMNRRSPRDWVKVSQAIVFKEPIAKFERLGEARMEAILNLPIWRVTTAALP